LATHPRNPFAGPQKALPPWAWQDAILKQNMPLKDLARWTDPQSANLDVSVHEFLGSRGATDGAIQLACDTNISYGTTTRDVSLLMQASVAQWVAVNAGTGVPFFGAVRGGNQRLPEAMARHLKGDLRKGETALKAELDSIIAAFQGDGTLTKIEADNKLPDLGQ
jgi:monoamine oxidase